LIKYFASLVGFAERKDINVNEHKILSNFTLEHKLN